MKMPRQIKRRKMMENRRKWLWLAFIFVSVCLASALVPRAAAQQEPILVGRLAYMEGQILRYVPESDDWVFVVKDAPFGLNDALYSDESSKAELTFPNLLVARIGASTQIQLICLGNEASEMDVASGFARFYNMNRTGVLKVTTPFGYVLADPASTFDLYVGDQSVEILALSGRVEYFRLDGADRYEVPTGGASILADATQVATGEGGLDAQWDDWNGNRDVILAQKFQAARESLNHLPPQLGLDASDLDESGKWMRVMYDGEYRDFWRPTDIDETWQPFTVGRWTDYYGDQVWMPEEPFGYLTSHYGNWLLVDDRWYWAPPAAVAAGPSIGFGWYPGRVAWISSGANAGWIPLAPNETYYSHHYWGPSGAVVTSVPVASVLASRLTLASAAVVIPQKSFYSVSNYSHVARNIDQTALNKFHAAPVVNDTVVKDYTHTKAKYNFVDEAPKTKPHLSVTERVRRNEQLAGTEAKSLTISSLKHTVTSTRRAAPMAKGAVTSPTKLTSKLVPPNKVNAPKDQALFRHVDIKKDTRPIKASSVVKSARPSVEAPGNRPSGPGVTQPHPATVGTSPPPPVTHPPPVGGAHPEIQPPARNQPAPPATNPPAATPPQPAPVPRPSPAPASQPAPAPRPSPAPAPAPRPAPALRPAPAPAPAPQPAPAPRPAPAPTPAPQRPPAAKPAPAATKPQ
jgi:hypothetical protein